MTTVLTITYSLLKTFLKYGYPLLFVLPLTGQTTSNPDISVIGQLVLSEDQARLDWTGSDIELAITGYVNPFARAEVYVHKHDAESSFELEEAFLNIERGLPLGIGLRSGRMQPTLGRMNLEHFHTWPFIEAPIAFTDITGSETWSSDGAEASFILPLPWYSSLTAGIFNSQPGAEVHSHDESSEPESEESSSRVMLGHFTSFFEFSPVTYMEVGSSILREQDSEKFIFGMDLKVRWRPDGYRGLTLQSELFLYPEEDHGDDMNAGVYGYINYQFNRSWNIGAIFDGLKHAHEDLSLMPGVFIGFSPVEESMVLRLALKQEPPSEGSGVTVLSQLIWSLGPHKPHRF